MMAAEDNAARTCTTCRAAIETQEDVEAILRCPHCGTCLCCFGFGRHNIRKSIPHHPTPTGFVVLEPCTCCHHGGEPT
jgi:hypothetical protein